MPGVFSAGQRDRVRDRVLAMARSDPRVVAAVGESHEARPGFESRG